MLWAVVVLLLAQGLTWIGLTDLRRRLELLAARLPTGCDRPGCRIGVDHTHGPPR